MDTCKQWQAYFFSLSAALMEHISHGTLFLVADVAGRCRCFTIREGALWASLLGAEQGDLMETASHGNTFSLEDVAGGCRCLTICEGALWASLLVAEQRGLHGGLAQLLRMCTVVEDGRVGQLGQGACSVAAPTHQVHILLVQPVLHPVMPYLHAQCACWSEISQPWTACMSHTSHYVADSRIVKVWVLEVGSNN